MHYDVFNGDADGICALHQLRLNNPLDSELITGVKRDVKLLQRLAEVRDSTITVLDISMDANKTALLELLEQNNTVQYFDHHFAGEIPKTSRLDANIDTDPMVCTSILVDRFLQGQYRPWAVVAAFGDNLHRAAQELVDSLELAAVQIEQLQELGELLNYNGYGPEIEDLHFSPIALYQAMIPFENPWNFYHHSAVLTKLKKGYAADMEQAQSYAPLQCNSAGSIYSFPAESWSKRVAGVFSNRMARDEPEVAHALLVDNGDNSYLVSVRSPLKQPVGADVLCRAFKTGGGRKAAAGINRLPQKELAQFLARFEKVFTKTNRSDD